MFTLLQKNIPEDLFLSVCYIHFCSNIIHICHSVYRWVDPKDLSNDTWRSNKKPWTKDLDPAQEKLLLIVISNLVYKYCECVQIAVGPLNKKERKKEKIIMAAFHTHTHSVELVSFWFWNLYNFVCFYLILSQHTHY